MNDTKTLPAYFSPTHFSRGEKVMYGFFPGTIVRYDYEGAWEVRLPGGVVRITGAHLEKTA